jgi:hypothetical protein
VAGIEVRVIREVLACCVSGSLPDFSTLSTITGGGATHVDETVADITIQSFLRKNNAINRNPQTQHSG